MLSSCCQDRFVTPLIEQRERLCSHLMNSSRTLQSSSGEDAFARVAAGELNSRSMALRHVSFEETTSVAMVIQSYDTPSVKRIRKHNIKRFLDGKRSRTATVPRASPKDLYKDTNTTAAVSLVRFLCMSLRTVVLAARLRCIVNEMILQALHTFLMSRY
jgi:hypothetical protein